MSEVNVGALLVTTGLGLVALTVFLAYKTKHTANLNYVVIAMLAWVLALQLLNIWLTSIGTSILEEWGRVGDSIAAGFEGFEPLTVGGMLA